MIEIMVTVVIIATCLVIALRGFSICAVVVSGTYNRMLAVEIMQEKIDELREKAILEDGVWVSSDSDSLTIDGRSLQYNSNILEWEDIDEEETEFEGLEIPDPLKLCEVELNVTWRAHGKSKGLKLKTIIPAKGAMDKL